jgi:hypothetical protein
MTPHEALREIAWLADYTQSINGRTAFQTVGSLMGILDQIYTYATAPQPADTVAVPRELLERAEDVAHANGHDDLAASLRALLGNKP